MRTIQTETVRTDRMEMDFFRFGQGKKKMMMLPGLSIQSVMHSAAAIAGEYELLQDAFTVFVFDRRRNLTPGCTVSEMARDTILAMEELGLREVCLFGASQGGMIALEIAAQRPALVRKLAVASTVLCMNESRRRPILSWIEKAKKRDGEGLYLDFGRWVYPPERFRQYQTTLAEMGKTVTEDEFLRFIISAEAAQAYDFKPQVRKIQCPLWAVGSRDDPIFGETAVLEIADAFRGLHGFEYYLYEGYGHAVYDTAPDFQRRLYTFLMKPPESEED